MAIDAKMSFLRQLEDSCADKLTQKDLQQMLQICSDVLEGYDMREVSAWGNEGPAGGLPDQAGDDRAQRLLKQITNRRR